MESSSEQWFKSAPASSKVLAPGVYRATLKRVFPGKARRVSGSIDISTLCFSFQTADGASVLRTVNSSQSEKSECIKLIKAMAIGREPSLTNEILQNGALLKGFIEALIGSEFLIQTEPSSNKKYNNLRNIFPIPQNA